ncbi:structural maintenance of chromosomes protein 5 isoform X2 [Syngnathoides biaculeatus]|uniref:structural maintenance of chromosomes protein 5 isoform X2 n=1 Tax=Syngnathoides biaculeatus TaxID=300417 RepID=UPI002ADDA269|nr:structural maintenance of chromosomes protein 5 isoform X2 [Syngnathoides biaculeatus]
MATQKKKIRYSNGGQSSAASVLTSRRPSEVNEADDGFVEGSVVRITMKNFMTYNYIMVRPGPNLNMIIGANGTGKSSIVCAICLSLAGKTTVLGRDDKVGGYVKTGCDKGFVEIELFKSGGNVIINREIHVENNQSVWKLNGRICNQKTVEEEVKALHIQVNNLCQFLPQEKVGQFAKMSKIELLEATEKSVGSPEMFEYHCELKNSRSKDREMENVIKEKTSYLEKTKQRFERHKLDENRYYEKQRHLNAIELIEKKIPWVEYETTREELEGVKKERDKAKKQLAVLKQAHMPMLTKLQSIEEHLKPSEEQMKAKSAAIKEASSKCKLKRDQLDRMHKDIEDIKQAFKMKQTEEEDQTKRIKNIILMIEDLKVVLAEVDKQPDVTPRITEVNAELRQIQTEREKVQKQKADLRQEKDNLSAELRMLEKKLTDMNNVMTMKEEKLRGRHRDTHTAVEWLRQHRDLFSGNVCEPLMLVINMKDHRFAKYLENHISFNDLRAFVFQRKEDMDKFLFEVRDKMSLRINVIIAPTETWSRAPPSRHIESLRRFGFFTYLRETFDAPEEVMSYLCQQYKVHEIPIGNEQTEAMIATVIKEPYIKVLYTKDQKYTVKKSFYSNITSTKNTTVYPSKYLSITVDAEQKRQLEQQMNVCRSKLRDIDERLNIIQNEATALDRRDNELLSEKKNLLESKGKKRQLEQKISTKQDRLKQLEHSGIDLKKAEAETKKKIIAVNSKKKSVVTTLIEQIKLQAKLTMEKEYLALEMMGLLAEKTKLENLCREGTSGLKAMTHQCSQLEESAAQLKIQCKENMERAKSICKMQPNETLPRNLHDAFSKLPNTLDELDAMLNEERSRAESFPGLTKKVVEECNKQAQEIKQLEQELTEKNAALIAFRQKMSEAKEYWLTPLKQLVQQINKKFSDFFRALECTGEVDLHYDNEDEYDKYGISILVKFHESSQLHELTQFHQSGGERSVATMLYLMALQELIRCPFRVVDEINQGMDSINERKVFDILVHTACKERTSQYFFITPKLLQNLTYVEEMTILCVNNSSHMLCSNEWDESAFLQRCQQKKKVQA